MTHVFKWWIIVLFLIRGECNGSICSWQNRDPPGEALAQLAPDSNSHWRDRGWPSSSKRRRPVFGDLLFVALLPLCAINFRPGSWICWLSLRPNQDRGGARDFIDTQEL